MSNASETQDSKLDPLKWVLVLILVGVAVAANTFFGDHGALVRWGAIIASAAVGLLIASTTAKGKGVLASLAQSRTEMRKVVWPTTQETNQTTMIVVIAVTIAAIILYLLDSLFGWIVKAIIG